MAYLEFTAPDFRTWLELYNWSTVTHSNNTGRIGMYLRSASVGYTYETILKFDISQLLFSTLTNVDLEWTSSSKGAQDSGGAQSALLYKQDKTDFLSWSSTPRFDDFVQTDWATQLAAIASVWNTGTYTFLDNSTFRQYIQDWITFGKNNDGLIISIDFGAVSYWLSLDSVKLKVTYTPPTNTPWGTKYVIDQNVGVSDCRLIGGTSPNLDNMVIKSISIAVGTNKSENLRLGVYTGGAVDNPVGASLLWDAGQISGSGGNKWYTITHPTGGIVWPKNTITWLAWKANGGTTDTCFTGQSGKSGDIQSARGRWASTSMDNIETNSFESTVSSGGAFTNYWYPIVVQYAIEVPVGGDENNTGLHRGIFRGIARGI